MILHTNDSLDSKQAAANHTLRSCVLWLLAQVMPEECFSQVNNLEAAYLKPYRRLFADVPENRYLEAITNTDVHGSPDEQELVKLARGQNLSLLEMIVMFLCYEIERDPMAGRCIAYLQQPLGGSRPTLSLLSSMLSVLSPFKNEAAQSRTLIARIAQNRAVQLGLLQVLNESAPLPEQVMQLAGAVALTIASDDIAWPGATAGLNVPAFELPESIIKAARLQAEALQVMTNNVLVVRCPSGREASIAANAIAGFIKRSPLFINDEEKALPALGPVCREKGLIPVFTYACGPGEQVRLPQMAGYEGPVMVIAGLEGSFESSHGTVTSWTIPRPTQGEREHLWKTCLGNDDLAIQLAGDHVHSTARIVELAGLAKRQGITNQKDIPAIEEVRQAAWLSESGGLSSLAQPVDSQVRDETLIVPVHTRRQLELFERRCRIRERLVDKLGITLKACYQMGVKALFTGPSGTGKTLAAGWLANKLGLPLYRVDLASITSKYIGETEKNLAKLLAQAEQEEVVLLFDEADSLFGKRTDVKDSNDRFANAQTNYLLQRIETYSGVVILTSNSRARFDSAFTRRIDMMIEFPMPNPEERRSIWLNHLGDYHQLMKGNINQLASLCDFSGGHIRNVVLTAAVIASQNHQPIVMDDIVIALAGEYRKLGKQMPPELGRVTLD